MPFQPTVSIIINTDGRAQPLATCLESLRYLRYPNFEVVVVAGPTRDGTHELCASWGDAIKFGDCPVRNLSQSRNISIGLASGEIVAFLDDDSVPEPEWLDDVIPAFQDPEVAVAGGFLHDHTGKTYQWQFGTANRFGAADTSWTRATPEFNYPKSFNFPHVMANSAFRRTALLEVGGFDEEYEYFLDETDVICRFVDAGWKVAQLDTGFIHHKFMPSHIRNTSRILTSWYSIIKNKAYFSLRNGRDHGTLGGIVADLDKLVQEYRGHVHWAIGEKMLPAADALRYEDEAERGLREGITRGLAGARRLCPPEDLRGDKAPFVLFPPKLPAAQQRCYVLLTRTYPPGSLGGIGRFVHQLARTLAACGHQVHVLTTGSGHDRVDFEENVWVHRIVVKKHAPPDNPALKGIPEHIWDYSRTMLDEALEIASRRRVDAVEAPIWDVEGAAFLGQPTLPLVTSLHTTLKFYLASNPELQADARFMSEFAEPMLRIERLLLESSEAIHANSHAIVEEIEAAYGVTLDRNVMRVVSHGLDDWTANTSQASAPKANAGSQVRVFFIGRLELRKGADVALQIAPALLRDRPEVRLEFFGNDAVPSDDGRSWRERFESQPEFAAVRDKVVFHGEVSDERLRQAYAEADIVLAPSRFESFGLVHLEAQMYGKPVIGCSTGGMLEVVDDGVTGILAEPGDGPSLLHAVERLVSEPALRERMGRAARQRYLDNFTPERMAQGVLALFDDLASRRAAAQAAAVPAPAEAVIPAARAAAPVAAANSSALRIAIVTSVLAPYDAISNDVVRHARFLRDMPGAQVTVFAMANQRGDIAARLASRVSDLLLMPEFAQADLIVWHFGIYYPLFDGIYMGNGRARQAVVFHNITPPEFAPPHALPTIEKSFAQLPHLQVADAIWADSRENAEMLIERGFDAGKITIQPLAVDRPQRMGIRNKSPGDALQVLFVGRIVPSKGLHDLVEALALVDTSARVQVKVVGDWGADMSYRDRLLARIAELGLKDRITFTGAVPDDERDRLLAASHVLAMPSYHEGFCVPVIEALRAGMVPVVYAAHNLRYIADGLCVSCAPGDINGLAAALSRAVADVDAVLRSPDTATLRLDRGAMSVAEFERNVDAHLEHFEPANVAQHLRALVMRLAERSSQPALESAAA